MAGGAWNGNPYADLPGVYIDFRSADSTLVSVGELGTVAIARPLGWGPVGEIVEINSTADVFAKLGYDVTSPDMLFMQQIFRGSSQTLGANKVLFYRLGTTGGVAATAVIGAMTVTANYVGTRGNDISIIITPDLDSKIEDPDDDIYAIFTVDTVVSGVIRDSQTVGSWTSETENAPGTIEELTDNNWVKFTGTGAITPTAGVTLATGADGDLVPSAYADFLDALEPFAFNILIYDGDDATVKAAYATFVENISFGSGKYCQMVCADYASADSECVISVLNGVDLLSGRTLTNAEATWWVGGAEAGCPVYESLTYSNHPDAIAPNPRLTRDELKAGLKAGNIMFDKEFEPVYVVSDVNTLTSFTTDKGKTFSKNQTIRVLWSFANDIYRSFSLYYIGKTKNTAVGRNLLKQAILDYGNRLDGQGAIQNWGTDSVTVERGPEPDSVIINVYIQIANVIEKIFITVTVTDEDSII